MVDLFRFYRALAIAAGFVPAGTEKCLIISSGFVERSEANAAGDVRELGVIAS